MNARELSIDLGTAAPLQVRQDRPALLECDLAGAHECAACLSARASAPVPQRANVSIRALKPVAAVVSARRPVGLSGADGRLWLVAQTLLVLIKKLPPKGRRLLIIGTTAQMSILEHMEIASVFSVHSCDDPMDPTPFPTVRARPYSHDNADIEIASDVFGLLRRVAVSRPRWYPTPAQVMLNVPTLSDEAIKTVLESQGCMAAADIAQVVRVRAARTCKRHRVSRSLPLRRWCGKCKGSRRTCRAGSASSSC
jgi:hypothetical protein